MATTKATFEEALDRLEKLVEEMESGKLSLDKMISCYEEGSVLVQQCGKTLNEVEQKIEKLVKKGEKMVAEPLNPAMD